MTNSCAESIGSVLRQWRRLGERQLPNGTTLIGQVPHVAPEAWLHAEFAPLSEAQIVRLQDHVGHALPPSLVDFYRRWNGLSIFSGSLSIYGLRESYERNGDAVWQPFDLRIPNAEERPRGTAESWVFFGGYKKDGSRVCIDGEADRVMLCSPHSALPVREWPDLAAFLHTEVVRLAGLFDEAGRLTIPNPEGLPDRLRSAPPPLAT